LGALTIALSGWRALGVLALGLGVAAAQVLPSALWIAASARSAGGLAAADASKWALTLRRLPELVAPGFFGRPEAPMTFWGAPWFDTGIPFLLSLHVGGAILLLAALAVLPTPSLERAATNARGLRMETALALVAAGFLVLAVAASPARLGGIVPGAALFRYPEKFVLGTVLGLALLASSGVERLLASESMRRRTTIASMAGAAMLLVAIIGKGVWTQLYLLPDRIPQGLPGYATWALALGALELALLAAALLATPRVDAPAKGPLLASVLAAGLLLGALVPGSGPLPWRLRANPSVPASFYDSQPFFLERLKAVEAAGERVFRFDRPPGFAVLNRTGTLADGHQ